MKKSKAKAKPKAASRAKGRRTAPDDDCVIPSPIAEDDLPRLVLRRDEDEVERISSYVEWQAKSEKVLHAEKVSTEHVMGRKYDCWDVRTDKERYWVITTPTNLYSQKLMPSLDYTLSFHVGVTARMASNRPADVDGLEQIVMADAWRRWEQAGELLNKADEAEDFQTVGMRCRECLISMVKTLSLPMMVPSGEAAPKHADVVHWCELIADHVAKGSPSLVPGQVDLFAGFSVPAAVAISVAGHAEKQRKAFPKLTYDELINWYRDHNKAREADIRKLVEVRRLLKLIKPFVKSADMTVEEALAAAEAAGAKIEASKP
jgi:hypothetical protein